MLEDAEDLLTPPAEDVDLPHVRALDLGAGTRVEFCWVPPGSCRVGSRSGSYHVERPVRRLHVPRGFWLGRTALTRGQWQALFGAVPGEVVPDLADQAQHPRVDVSWFDALEACLRLQARFLAEHPAPVGPRDAISRATDCRAVTWTDAPGFRLPSELEWEYACRGAGRMLRGLGERPFGEGDEVLDASAWYERNSGERTHPVGSDPTEDALPHPLGLRQMIGNVAEWCLDLYLEERSALAGACGTPSAHGGDPSDAGTSTERQSANAWFDAATRHALSESDRRAVLRIVEAEPTLDAGLARLQDVLDRELPPSPRNRVVRGGSFDDSAWGCRSAYRVRWTPDDRLRGRGFRVCLFPGPVVPASP